MISPPRVETAGRRAALLALLLPLLLPAPPAEAGWHFEDVTAAAGLAYEHGFVGGPSTEPRMISGGVAVGDYDGDGFPDVYAVRGTIGPNLLFHNLGDGTFEEVGAAAGVALEGERGSGPAFADLDGDGYPELVIGGVDGTGVRLFRNQGDGTFEEMTAASGIVIAPGRNTFSAAFGDPDRDGDLDVVFSHWGQPGTSGHLWANDGFGHFTDVGLDAGISGHFALADYTFTPTFTDLDDDGWPDLVYAADFDTSRVFRNLGDGTFTETTDAAVVTDENGMGSALGDYDGDGDLDWFVSSIWDPDGMANGNWGVTGNRLYRNLGDGTFEDATEEAGVRRGYWGWGSCFADFDNDGHLDLFHVNGFASPAAGEFFADPARLFVNQGDATFAERGTELGVADTGQGRGISCFDYDRDGDLDILVANNSGPARLFRNELPAGPRSLTVALTGRGLNTEAVGARVWATAGGRTQVREIRAGSNFVSQNPAEAHFGLGAAPGVDELRIRWPDETETVLTDVEPTVLLEVVQGVPPVVAVPALPGVARGLLAALLALAGGLLLARRHGTS